MSVTGDPLVPAESFEETQRRREENEIEQGYRDNRMYFDTTYRYDIEHLGADLDIDITGAIAGVYESTGDIVKAVQAGVQKIGGGEDLVQAILSYLDQDTTNDTIIRQLQEPQGITVQKGMELGYINALTHFNNRIDFGPLADKIFPGDIIRVAGSDIFINDKDVGDVLYGHESVEEQEEEKFFQHPIYPILSKYQAEKGFFVSEEVNIGKIISEGGDNLEASILSVIKAGHPAREEIRQYFGNIEVKSDNFYKDHSEAEGSKGNRVNTLLSENYVQVLAQDGSVNTDMSLRQTFSIAANSIVSGRRNFRKTIAFTEAYERLQHAIENGISEKQLGKDLLTIDRIVNDSEGVRGKNTQEKERRVRNNAEQKALYLSEQFGEIQRLLRDARENQNKAEVERLNNAAKALAVEADNDEVLDSILGGFSNALDGGQDKQAENIGKD